jgi:histidine triad (HIT) family protein
MNDTASRVAAAARATTSALPSDPDCPFCRIASGQAHAHIVAADEYCLAVLDASPAARGHTLVIPRAHVADLWSADPEIAAAVGRTCAVVARQIRARLQPDGLTMRQNTGEASGQRVFHLHVHLVPRWHGDGTVGWPWPPPTDHDPTGVLRELAP